MILEGVWVHSPYGVFRCLGTLKGNLALCGFPLTIECHDNNGTIPIGKGEDNDDEDGDDFELSWFFVSMGLGFIIGFWGVCGTLIIKTSWRYAYFCFVEKMKDRLILVVALNVARLARKVCFGCTQEVNLHCPIILDDIIDFFHNRGILDFTFDSCRLVHL
ncbi:hypothetical protein CK203_113840 [Vitis vinifera]|uniref:Uncharacterized protein n=1 Tax=Vitis vinifera TaxID=29760 RepID=A0A438D459_VITVI|nr:hypothetical protein CK203_113840 [Vitis vinifera]